MLNVQLDTIRAELAAGHGLSMSTWDFVTAHVGDIAPQLSLSERAELADAAFLACHYETARILNVSRPLWAGQTAIYLRDEKALNEILSTLLLQEKNAQIEATLTIATLEIMKLRLLGEHTKAIEVFEQRMLPLLESNKFESDLAAQVYMIAGTPYFHANKYSAARELYAKAAEIFEHEGEKNHGGLAFGFAAVCAYNLVVSCDYLDLKFEAKSWSDRCQKHLARYSVPGLSNTLDMCHLQELVSETKYESAIDYGNQFLSRANLMDIQRLTALVTVAQASLECGHLVRSQFRLNQAQQLIASKKFSQFSPFCEALEQEICNFTYRSRAGFTTRAKDQRAALVLKLALCRQFVTLNRPSLAVEVLTEVKNEFPQSLLRRSDFTDLEVILNSANPDFLTLTPRAFWSMALRCIEKRDFDSLQELLSSNVLSDTAFHALAREFARGVLDTRVGEQQKALRHFQDALERSRLEGIERITSLALGYLAHFNPSYESEWTDRLDTLTENDREALQLTMRRLLGDEHNTPAESAKGSGLMIDETAGTVIYNGQNVPLQGHSVLFRLLLAIAKSGSRGLCKDEISSQVWKHDYNPLQHDSLIYVTINRLREIIPVELHGGQYRLPRNVSRQIVSTEASLRLDEREQQVLELLAGPFADGIQRLDVVDRLKISARTALRILNGLVAKRYLVRIGQGRGVIYAEAKGAIA